MSAGIIQARANLEAHLPELRKFVDLTPLEGELEQALSKDHIDLSLTIRNTHVAVLMQGDMDTWARIADRMELHRDLLAKKVKTLEARREYEIETAVYLAREESAVERAHFAEVARRMTFEADEARRSRDSWRALAAILAFAWTVFAVAVLR